MDKQSGESKKEKVMGGGISESEMETGRTGARMRLTNR